MYDDWGANLVVVAATVLAVAGSVLIHYEGLIVVARGLARLHARHQRVKVLYAIASLLLLHIAEIWLFGLTLWLLLTWPPAGHVAGQGVAHLLDAVYLSAVTYTTVGYGDMTPVGPIRFLAGTEALTGFVLITWSASFTYLEMERFWRRP